MSFDHLMHTRNRYKHKPPNFMDLAKKYKKLRELCRMTTSGRILIDFKDDKVVRILSETLLEEDFNIRIQIPKNYLVPRIPQRLNYVLVLEDLLLLNGFTDNVIGLDIGTGPACIYPLLAIRQNPNWKKIYASELDPVSFSYALANAHRNVSPDQLIVFEADADHFFKVMEKESEIAFSMCNPPFFDGEELDSKFNHLSTDDGSTTTYSNALDGLDETARSRTIAKREELCFEGGEVGFVQKMIEESLIYRGRIAIYSTLLGKKSSVRALTQTLNSSGIQTHHSWNWAEFHAQMDVESPTQHSPIYVDVHSHYRVTFDNMKYQSTSELWDITVRLEDKKEERILGETHITWPHTDPPHTIIYDAEGQLLQWENSESIAYLPIRIPTRTAYDLSIPHERRNNPKILLRPPLSLEPSNRSSMKVHQESNWKEIILNKKFHEMTAKDIKTLKPDFNPLFEERLTSEEQQKALSIIVKSYSKKERLLMNRLLTMRFFDLSSLNMFIASLCIDIDRKDVQRGTQLADVDMEEAKIVNDHLDQNGSTSSAKKPRKKVNHASGSTAPIEKAEVRSEAKKSMREGEKLNFIYDLLNDPQVLLFDNSFVTLLSCASRPSARRLRKILANKNMPLNSGFRKRIFAELETPVIVSLLEFYAVELLTDVDQKDIKNILDLLLFITDGFNDKMLWEEDGTLTERLQSVRSFLNSTSRVSLLMTRLLSRNTFRDVVGPMPPPQTDYLRRRVQFKSKPI